MVHPQQAAGLLLTMPSPTATGAPGGSLVAWRALTATEFRVVSAQVTAARVVQEQAAALLPATMKTTLAAELTSPCSLSSVKARG